MIRRRLFIKLVILFVGMVILYKGIFYTITLEYTGTKYNTNENARTQSNTTNSSSIHRTFVKTVQVPTIYVVTPTYSRYEQKAELTRLSQTLRLVHDIHWVIVEDSSNTTGLVRRLLQRCGVSYTHLYIKSMSSQQYREAYNINTPMPRGGQQRNLALDWIEKNAEGRHVVYFADDDNTYDVRIFEEMRYTQNVSVWPVGLVGGSLYESPVVKHGKVIGWVTGFRPDRPFATDMAGFAVNGQLIKTTKARFDLTCYTTLEPCFLSALKIGLEDLEPKAENCTQILVWHTRTAKTNLGRDKTRLNVAKSFSANSLEV